MIQKKSALSPVLKNGAYQFQIESEHRPGKWIGIDEDMPIKHGSDLRCFVLKCNTFEFDTESVIMQNESSNQNRDSGLLQSQEQSDSQLISESESGSSEISTSGNVVYRVIYLIITTFLIRYSQSNFVQVKKTIWNHLTMSQLKILDNE